MRCVSLADRTGGSSAPLWPLSGAEGGGNRREAENEQGNVEGRRQFFFSHVGAGGSSHCLVILW